MLVVLGMPSLRDLRSGERTRYRRRVFAEYIACLGRPEFVGASERVRGLTWPEELYDGDLVENRGRTEAVVETTVVLAVHHPDETLVEELERLRVVDCQAAVCANSIGVRNIWRQARGMTVEEYPAIVRM